MSIPCLFVFVLLLLILPLKKILASSNLNQGEEFSFNGFINMEGIAVIDSSGQLFKLTNITEGRTLGRIFYDNPIQFKNSSTNGNGDSSAFSFSTTFIFALVPEYPRLGGHGLAFVLSPNKAIQDVGDSDHIVAIELDAVQDFESSDMDDNHVGIDINSPVSEAAAPAGYFADDGKFNRLSLNSGDPLQIWIEYNGVENQLNVTLYPINIPKPKTPLLSYQVDLSMILYDYMYVGFSSSPGLLASSQYILAWSFKTNGQAEQLDLSRLPKYPRPDRRGGYNQLKKILAVTLSLAGLTLVLVLIFGVVLISRKKRFIEILEDWEVQYGPHRFSYKDLFKATKGFKEKQLLGKGGFGRVYKGMLPSSNAQIAVKRVSHDSRQGMREFVAEIATIGRLRHPNLVRLLGYCRRKHELLLVYDYMPNGSLDKFLYHLPNSNLNWTQRFKIIKDVASALFYLHQQWIQIIIHRDIKPANVLIDNEMNARLGDFGLAKLCELGNDLQTSHVAGTLGYMAPELMRTGKASTNTDIYAFGVFMLEVASGRRPIDPQQSPDKIMLIDWIMDCWDGGEILESIDSGMEKRLVVKKEAELVLKLGLLCSHPVAAARPSMSSVLQYLDGVARLPDDLSTLIKARDFPTQVSNDEGAPDDSLNERNYIPSLTITESFESHGR